ncbi:bifunctional [glutamate--ammonia ligase]-adenylyl-L-tyrosine phosphorylase/[glutamate--ammonia-ligase] adenylyltransferase [Minwuia thermotolerans]|uniref:Bifunctional glutamine synthetase adenylyltransferase/adenylyl-removing enzyme n=2 Tax=Minwuia thermotolerans TaxID=2056226 RepID=A0A2M9G179_9PROT|nr:bifunctional [glutamate--ammonia ligase]-adenylyl-L-tyrosine phosphorylase/[glutamate--ammonia-ligase] adenylyltransferase [Minwuia thermotolerans]
MIRSAPLPADAEAAGRAWERWRAAARTATAESDDGPAGPETHDGFRTLLDGVFGCSPYLTGLAMKETDIVLSLATRSPEEAFATILDELRAPVTAVQSNRVAAQELRRAKRRAALLIGLADLGGAWRLEQVTSALTDLADAAVHRGLGVLLRQSAEKGDIEIPEGDDPAETCGVVAIAMGKMGAFELNYSSDIDLIVVYDPERIRYRGARDISEHASRLTRSLVQLMQERTGDGYVFRTDLRLRPDPSVSPLAVSLENALTYYETMAQNWERAAMIKARAAAGDIALGEMFLHELSPFIWRKSLDFAAIADIQSIKRQIHSSKGHDRIAVAGHDIKVGRGGIREIEFFAQTQQLIAGGRDPRLRIPATVAAVDALVETGRVEPVTAEELKAAYVHLRSVEHRLQMLDDAQTQKLPSDEAGLRRLARFCGYRDTEGFAEALTGHMRRVAGHYADLFAEEPSLAADQGNLVFTGTDDDPGTVESLAEMGFGSPSSVISSVKSWHSGRYRALRTTRARQLLTTLAPTILTALSRTSNPDGALANFDRFLSRLPAGVQFMSLLHANPGLLTFIARIMGTAPALADTLSRNAGLLDILLDPGDEAVDDLSAIVAHCDRELSMAENYEDVLDAVRRFANDRKFEIGVGLLNGSLTPDAVGRGLTRIADTSIRALLPHVAGEVARRHGHVPGAGMAVIAMGKLGAEELTFGSDLDLVFVYDDRGEAKHSDGPAALQIGPYFSRLSQRFISAVNTMTSEGQLYEVDMRLRPSGNKSAVAVPLSAYSAYMQNDAWTWEVMAATRARIIAGPEDLAENLLTTLREIVLRRRDGEDLRRSVLDMRRRIAKQHGTRDPWSVKHVRGGLVDLEFLTQYLILAHASDRPAIVRGHVGAAMDRLHEAGLLTETQYGALSEANRVLKSTQMLLRLCFHHGFKEANASEDFRLLAAEIVGGGDFDDVREAVRRAEADVYRAFQEILGEENETMTTGDSA